MKEHAGKGDPAKTMALLWRTERRADKPRTDTASAHAHGAAPTPTTATRRGPKPALDVEDIVTRAIAMADAEGLESASVRRLAEAMGVSAMSLYTYLPGKGELVELMVDRALGEQPLASLPVPASASKPDRLAVPTNSRVSTTASAAKSVSAKRRPKEGWRHALERYALDTRDLYQRHPWLLQVASARTVLGPHVVARLDAALGTLQHTALRGRDKVAIVSLIDGYVRGAVAHAIDAREARAATGESDDAWWQARAALLDARFEEAFAAGRFTHIAAVAQDGGFDEQGESPDGESHSQRRAREEFAFGLARVLDGIEAFVLTHSRTAIAAVSKTAPSHESSGRAKAVRTRATRGRAGR